MQLSGAGPLESGGGDKTKPFVQAAVTVQDEDVGAGAPARSRPPATATGGDAAAAAASDGGLVRARRRSGALLCPPAVFRGGLVGSSL